MRPTILLTAALLLAACGASDDPAGPPAGVDGASAPSGSAAKSIGDRPARRAVGARLARTYTWYDGPRRRTAWLDPARLVELRADDAGRQLVRRHAPRAEETDAGARGVRAWRLRDEDSADLAERLRRADPACRVSPAFHDGDLDTSAMRALTGRVLVRVREGWTREDVAAWAARNDLGEPTPLALRDTWVVEVGPGLEALRRANEIHESGQVVWATPEWWRSVASK